MSRQFVFNPLTGKFDVIDVTDTSAFPPATPNTIADDEVFTIPDNSQITYSGVIYIQEGGQIYTEGNGVLSWVN